MFIRRDKYLNELKLRMHNSMIKVVTGIKRSGKSFLLFRIFRDYLIESGINEDHIIPIELDVIPLYAVGLSCMYTFFK